MSVVYDVPRFSQKTTAQKGPTCWYYALKMLLKFHELFDRGSKEPENPLEVLHALRKVATLNNLRGGTRQLYDPSTKRLRHPLDGRLAELEATQKKALAPARDDPKQQLDPAFPPAIAAYLRARENEALASQIAHVKDLIQKDLDPARMKPVIALIEKKIEKNMEKELSRYDYLSFALPHIKFRQIPNPENAGMLEQSLRRFGPMYASGSLSIMKVEPDASGSSGSNERLVAVKELGGEGSHAVVIAGVSEQEEVFFKDPNRADELQCVHFRHFIASRRWRLQLVAIDCANRGDKPAGLRNPFRNSCIHCRQRLITEKVVPPLSVTR
jgi:hypothetical protein